MKYMILISTLVFSLQTFGACDFSTWSKTFCFSKDPIELGLPAPCQDASQFTDTIGQLKDAFDMAPTFFRAQLCEIPRLRIAPLVASQSGTHSWAFYYKDSQQETGINKIYLDRKMDLVTFNNEMLRFISGPMEVGSLGPETPHFTSTSNTSTSAYILSLLGHEMGHHIYNDDRFKMYFGRCPTVIILPEKCKDFETQLYGAVDWINGYKNKSKILPAIKGIPKEENQSLVNYLLADSSQKSIASLKPFFEGLLESGFVSTFSLASAEEDFCELYSMYILSQSVDSLVLSGGSQGITNVFERVRTPGNAKLKKKIEILKGLGI